MSTFNQQIVQSAFLKVQQEAEEVAYVQDEYNKQLLVVKEFQRQLAYHNANGDSANAQVVQGRLASAESSLAIIKNRLDIAKKEYQDALNEYNSLKDSVLTPAEKELEEERARLEAEKAKAVAARTMTEEEAAQQKAKIMRIVWIGLGILALGLIIWGIVYMVKKFRKKS